MARPDDLAELELLIREHALFERAAPIDGGLVARLESLLFSPPPRLHAIVAEGDGGLDGYATASLEVSTWRASHFLHLDCLYLRPGARGAGIGRRILDRVRVLALELGVAEVQWQTPDWNDDAVRFYERQGAVYRDKKRFTLDVTR
ncbi:GNAT superfamily N-acetyltransferase [Conyzicola nivalis]|uniref:GNAT superfamily N-acetyltransferase n=1 Tax=Conyzicola nivalis TaxID=1477021 RepID=A0ABV2QIB2_9MICO